MEHQLAPKSRGVAIPIAFDVKITDMIGQRWPLNKLVPDLTGKVALVTGAKCVVRHEQVLSNKLTIASQLSRWDRLSHSLPDGV